MTMDNPTAAKVPSGRLLAGSFRSPDMLTPWVNPVTAGKKIAKSTQKGGPPAGKPQLPAMTALSNFANPPAKKETSAAAIMTMITY